MASVSLCMIVKDEEDVLERCLAHAAGFADELVIVDTGSSDRTMEIAAKFTDKVYSFPWTEDFGAARNFAFGKGTGEYLFWLDADDVILEAEMEKLLILKKRLDTERPDVVMLKYAVAFDEAGRPTFSFYRERIIRNCEKAVWKGRIHEAITPFGKVAREDIVIEHRKIKSGDSMRNLRIFEAMEAEGQEFGARELYYYGKELYYHERYGEAARVLTEFLERDDGWKEDKVDGCRHLALCMRQLGEEKKELGALLWGLSFGCPKPELCCDLGGWFFGKRWYEEAVFWYKAALQNRRAAGNDGFVQEDLRGYVPCMQLCVCYDRMGKQRLARRYNELAERFKPGTEACAYNRRYFEGNGE